MHSPTLRQYHKTLWSKALPSGRLFELSDNVPGAYLAHHSDLGHFILASDGIVATYTRWVSMKPITEQFREKENEAFRAAGYTIGGFLLFPGNRIDRRNTINGARGFNRKIADRVDLTLECIRRHYGGLDSPLAETLERYSDFFELFGDFPGYVAFWLLQDLVDESCSAVRFFTPFEGFLGSPVPRDVKTYAEYRRRSIEFVHALNQRIATAASTPKGGGASGVRQLWTWKRWTAT